MEKQTKNMQMIMINKKGWVSKPVTQLPSPYYHHRPDKNDITTVVLHNISLPPLTFGRKFVDALFLGHLSQYTHQHLFFKKIEALRVSAHFFIARSGEITQYVSTIDCAWHAGLSHFQDRNNCNDFSIGIELNGADHIPYTHRQYLATAQLIIALQQAHPSINHITTHQHIAPQRKTDPGPAFNANYFQMLLKKIHTNCYTANQNLPPLSYHA